MWERLLFFHENDFIFAYMKTMRIYPTSINSRFIAEAVEAVRKGDVIIYPTDTFYAYGCDALNTPAIERLCKAKGLNPQKETLSIICADISQASEYARIDNNAFKLMKRHLPGPFTFILPAATSLPKAFKGRKTVGVRIPDNPIAVALAQELGHPLLTTTLPLPHGADEEDLVRPGSIAMLFEDKVSLLIDGGDGLLQPSTVVDITDSSSPEILRQGIGALEV